MKMILIALLAASLVACHGHPVHPVPSTGSVDSAAAAAPDTIKALPPDSIPTQDSVR
jgi:hypothetical protein